MQSFIDEGAINQVSSMIKTSAELSNRDLHVVVKFARSEVPE